MKEREGWRFGTGSETLRPLVRTEPVRSEQGQEGPDLQRVA